MSRPLRWALLALRPVLLICGTHHALGAPTAPCAGGWLSIQAEIVRITPASVSTLERRSGTHSGHVGVNAVLCEKDVLIVPSGTTVEIYEAGRTEILKSNYTVTANSAALSSKAADYLKAALALVSPDPPAARPTSTSVRGARPDAQDSGAAGLLAIDSIRDLPRQNLTRGLSPIVSWRDGAPAFKCDIVNEDTEVLWSSGPLNLAWCQYGDLPVQAARLRVTDSHRRSLGWNVTVSDWTEVPRPDWIAPTADSALAAPELSAWGIWLWENGSPAWRMQSLAILNKGAQSQWVARFFLDHVLVESPPIPAKP